MKLLGQAQRHFFFPACFIRAAWTGRVAVVIWLPLSPRLSYSIALGVRGIRRQGLCKRNAIWMHFASNAKACAFDVLQVFSRTRLNNDPSHFTRRSLTIPGPSVFHVQPYRKLSRLVGRPSTMRLVCLSVAFGRPLVSAVCCAAFVPGVRAVESNP